MQRLDWKIVSASTLSALHDGWAYAITPAQQDGWWRLCAEPIQDRGPDWRKWFTTAHLQDAMAIAEALAAGAYLS
jgi:hypothetical protein